MQPDWTEWDRLREQLRARGVTGVDELGRFVSNVEFFGASHFDARAAMPVLLDALPTLSDERLVGAVAQHLRRPWARGTAFRPLVTAFETWAAVHPTTGWALGDALGSAATPDDADTVVELARRREFGTARQMIVYALRRFRASDESAEAVWELRADDDVVLHAISSLRSMRGPEAALLRVEQVLADHPGSPAADAAAREKRKLVKLLQ